MNTLLVGASSATITVLSQRLLEDVGLDPHRWVALVDRITDIAPGAEIVLNALEAVELRMAAKSDRAVMWDELRRVLHHNRSFPDAGWALPEPLLERLDAIYDRFAPTDPLDQIAWLFQNGVALPRPSAEGWQANKRDVAAAQVYMLPSGVEMRAGICRANISRAAGSSASRD